MARPRKAAKRTKSGNIKRSECTPREIDAGPTDEMAARKAKVGGRDLGDVLSFIDLRPHQRDALRRFSILRGRFFRTEPKPSSLAEMIGGSRSPHTIETAQEKEMWETYKRAGAALADAGTDAHRTIYNLPTFDDGNLPALRSGADALADFFGVQREAS